MAVINGSLPPVPAPPPASAPKRVVVKFRITPPPPGGTITPRGLAGELTRALEHLAQEIDILLGSKLRPDLDASVHRRAASPWVFQNLKIESDGVVIKPYFEEDQQRLTPPPGATSVTDPELHAYFVIECSPSADTEAIRKTASALVGVEIAYIEAGPTPPPVHSSTNPLSQHQGYLDKAPEGINAKWAWSKSDGTGIGFVDIEQGWVLDHEDLQDAHIEIISGDNNSFYGHGTSVLGEVCAQDNNVGIVGIAPGATVRVVSQHREGGKYSTAEAILSAATVMATGDVLLLEAQTTYATVAGLLPVEVEAAVFDAIRSVVRRGAIVIEAGGNGSVDLDNFIDMNGKELLNRRSPNFKDSGAIIVGAASSASSHSRLAFSNFGNRIDCFAWGEGIETCGDGWMGKERNAYTPGFGGTSGASPMIAGAALLVQGAAKSIGKMISPALMRSLLTDPGLNTASSAEGDRIGMMPDLKNVITHIGEVG